MRTPWNLPVLEYNPFEVEACEKCECAFKDDGDKQPGCKCVCHMNEDELEAYYGDY